MATICWLYTDWVEAGGNIMPVITSLTVTTILPTRWPWVCPDFSRNFSLALRSNELLSTTVEGKQQCQPPVVGRWPFVALKSITTTYCSKPMLPLAPFVWKTQSQHRRGRTTGRHAARSTPFVTGVGHSGPSRGGFWGIALALLFMALPRPLCMIQRSLGFSLSVEQYFSLSTLVNHWLFIRPLLNTEEPSSRNQHNSSSGISSSSHQLFGSKVKNFHVSRSHGVAATVSHIACIVYCEELFFVKPGNKNFNHIAKVMWRIILRFCDYWKLQVQSLMPGDSKIPNYYDILWLLSK